MSYADDCLNRILNFPLRQSRVEWRRGQAAELKRMEAEREALEKEASVFPALEKLFCITYREVGPWSYRALGHSPDNDAKWLKYHKGCLRAVRDVYLGIRNTGQRKKLIALHTQIEDHIKKWAHGAASMAATHVEMSATRTSITATRALLTLAAAVLSVLLLNVWLGTVGAIAGGVIGAFLAADLVVRELQARHVASIELRQALQELENDSMAVAVLKGFPDFFDHEETAEGIRAEWYEKHLAEREDWPNDYPPRAISFLAHVHHGDQER